MQSYSYKTITQLEKSISESIKILDDIKYINIYNNNKIVIDSFLERNNLKVIIINEQIFIENSDNILVPLKLKKNIQKFMNIFDMKDKNISFIDIINSSYFLNDCEGLPCSILLNLELSKLKEVADKKIEIQKENVFSEEIKIKEDEKQIEAVEAELIKEQEQPVPPVVNVNVNIQGQGHVVPEPYPNINPVLNQGTSTPVTNPIPTPLTTPQTTLNPALKPVLGGRTRKKFKKINKKTKKH